MKNLILIVVISCSITSIFTACSKKEKGVCYCSYYSGDRTHYDLTALARDKAEDSCHVLDGLASNFAGSCSLK